jgi:hypothetical protein
VKGERVLQLLGVFLEYFSDCAWEVLDSERITPIHVLLEIRSCTWTAIKALYILPSAKQIRQSSSGGSKALKMSF